MNNEKKAPVRQIKFRGLRVDGKGWEYGDLIQNYIHHKSGATIQQGGCIVYEVISETVGQFTGLLDKNGKEIYEGDLISYYGGSDGKEIGYSKDGRLVWKNKHGHFTVQAIEIHDQFQMEVIGNIHEESEVNNG